MGNGKKYIDRVISTLQEKHANEPEFLQTVEGS